MARCAMTAMPVLTACRALLRPFRLFSRIRQGLPAVKHQVVLRIEGHCLPATEPQCTLLDDLCKPVGNGIDIDKVRGFALESEHHCLVGAMSLTGRAKRPVQFHADTGEALQHAVTDQALHEQSGRAHRPDRVRTRRSYPDFEQIENTDGHDVLACRMVRR